MAKPQHVLAIDQGTTGTHVAILDARCQVVGKAYHEVRQKFPQAGWVEHDLLDIWQTVERCVAKALRSAGLKGQDLAAIGITNQRETTGLWSRATGKPVHPAIVWQDRRTADRCQALKDKGLEPEVRKRTGLVLDPYFSGTKLAWLLEQVKGARAKAEKGELCFGTVDSWLVYQLTGRMLHVTDVTNASRTLLLNLESLTWDDRMLELLEVPRAVLPEVRASSEVYGYTKGLSMLPDGIPVAGIAGDQQSALFGQACFAVGEAKCTYGTGAFLLMNVGATPVASSAGLLSTVAWKLGDTTTYALEGSAFIAGAAVQWLRDGLKLIRKASEIEPLAASVKDSGEVVFVPALAGLGAPHWRPEARGLFAGIDRSTTAGHLARAVLEGIALQIFDLAEAMRKDAGRDIPAFKVDGGAAANGLLMQCQADLLGTNVIRPRNLETTSLGAAFLAGLAVGLWDTPEQIKKAWKSDRVFKPKFAPAARTQLLEKWARALPRA